MKLYVVQHGEAVPEDVNTARPLSEKGRADARQMADFLVAAGVKVGRVLHSEKLRALQTAEFLATRLAPTRDVEEHDGLGPNDPTDVIARRFSESAEDTLVVSHLPFIGKLVSQLVTGNEASSVVSFHPGSVVCLERDQENGSWSIAWMIRPELLAHR